MASFYEPIKIPPRRLIRPEANVALFVHPVVGKAAETWKGRIIFVDQLRRTHKTEKVELPRSRISTGNDLRHTFASRLVMAGVDIRTVQELMGHRTVTVTLRYAHLAPLHQLAAVHRLCDTRNVQESSTDTRTKHQRKIGP